MAHFVDETLQDAAEVTSYIEDVRTVVVHVSGSFTGSVYLQVKYPGDEPITVKDITEATDIEFTEPEPGVQYRLLAHSDFVGAAYCRISGSQP